MKKEDLKVGYVVKIRTGKIFMVMPVTPLQLGMISENKTHGFNLDCYHEDLRHKSDKNYDITEVYGYKTHLLYTLDVDTFGRELLWARSRNDPPLTILNAFADEVHKNAVTHGWWEEERSFAEIIALCHSELSEALEEYRKDADICYYYDNDGDICTDMTAYNGEKLEGIGVELADCVLRILDYCGKENIDIAEILKLKHEFNKTRDFKHGGKRI